MKYWMIIFAVLVICSQHAFGVGENGPEESSLIRVNSGNESANVKGEFINEQNNTHYWEVKDVYLAGNGGMDINVYRSYSKSRHNYLKEFETWDLEVPRIEFTASMRGDTNGERTGAGMCVDPSGYRHNWAIGEKIGERHDFTGLSLVIPGQAPKQLLYKSTTATYYPSDAKYVSQDNWIVRCVTSSDPYGAGNTFEAVSPNGETYTFDKIGRIPNPESWSYKGLMTALATKKQDLYGNWLEYHYLQIVSHPNTWKQSHVYNPADYKPLIKPYLNKITASDGRVVNLNYENIGSKKRLKEITAEGKTWKYRYSNVTRNDPPYNMYIAPYLKEVEAPSAQVTSLEYKIYFEQGSGGTNAYYADYFSKGGSGYAFIPLLKSVGFLPLLSKVTLPNNLSVSYEYEKCSGIITPIGDSAYVQDCAAALLGKDLLKGNVSPLTKRTLSGPNMNDIVWNIKRIPSLQETRNVGPSNVPNHVTTIYSTPTKTVVKKYYHTTRVQAGNDWKHGALLSKKVYSAGANINVDSPIFSEENVWKKGNKIGEDGIYYRDPNAKARGAASWTRQLLSKATVRIDGKQFVTEYQNYDDFGKPKKIIESGVAKVKTTNIVYENNLDIWKVGQIKSSRVVAGPWVTNVTNSLGQVTSTNSNGEHTLYEYHTDGSLKYRKWYKDSIQDIQKTQYLNYYRGVAQREINAENEIENLKVNSNGTIAWQEDSKGNRTQFEYDEMFRQKKIDWPIFDDSDISWSNWESKTEIRGNERGRVKYDSLNRPFLNSSWDTDNSGQTVYVRKEYDADSIVRFKSVPSFHSNETKGIRYETDSLGRITKSTDTSTNKSILYFYGSKANSYLSGHPVSVNYGYLKIDAEGYYSVFNYSGETPENAKLVKVSKMVRKSTHANGLKYITTDIQWDNFGNITKLTQGGITKSYEFYPDRPTLLKKSVQPEAVSHFTYDLAGNMKSSRIEGGATTKYSYDNENRLTLVDYPSGTDDITYTYDSNGNVETVKRADTLWTYAYNENNLITGESLKVGSKTFSTTYEYNNNGKLKTIVYPSSRRLELDPNAMGLPQKLNGYVTSIEYHPTGLAKSYTMGNGLTYSLGLNERQMPNKMSLKRGSTRKAELEYAYDDNRNVTFINNKVNVGYSVNMGYDGLDRLVKAYGNWGFGDVEYDDVGNIKRKRIGNHQLKYFYNNKNQLQSITGARNASFTYDVQGNVSSNGINNYHYDASNELTDVTGGASTAYVYDGNNKRVLTYRDDAPVYHVYSSNGLLLHKYDSSTDTKMDYVYLNDKAVAKIKGEPSVVAAPNRVASVSVPSTDNDGAYQVNWSASTGATYYVVQEQKNNGGWTEIYSGNSQSTNLSNRTSGAYIYQVKACNSGGCSGSTASNTITVLIPAPIPTLPAPSSINSPANDIDGTFRVSWSNVSGATYYKLSQARNIAPFLTTYTGGATSVWKTNLPNGFHKFKVQACNANGCGDFSGMTVTAVSNISPCIDPKSCFAPELQDK